MARQAARRKEHHVDSDVVARAREARGEHFGGGGDAAQAIRVDREVEVKWRDRAARRGRPRRRGRGGARPICASRGGAATRRRGVRPCVRALRRRRGSSPLFQGEGAGVDLVPVAAEAFGDRLCRLRDGLVGHRLAQRRIERRVVGFLGHRFARRADDDDDLALRRRVGVARRKLGQRAGDAFLVKLADLARDREADSRGPLS